MCTCWVVDSFFIARLTIYFVCAFILRFWLSPPRSHTYLLIWTVWRIAAAAAAAAARPAIITPHILIRFECDVCDLRGRLRANSRTVKRPLIKARWTHTEWHTFNSIPFDGMPVSVLLWIECVRIWCMEIIQRFFVFHLCPVYVWGTCGDREPRSPHASETDQKSSHRIDRAAQKCLYHDIPMNRFPHADNRSYTPLTHRRRRHSSHTHTRTCTRMRGKNTEGQKESYAPQECT